MTAWIISIASSRIGSVWLAISELRSRHWDGGVAGGRTGLTYTPCSNSFFAVVSVAVMS